MTKALQVERGTTTSDALQQYLNESTKKIGIFESRSARDFGDELFQLQGNRPMAFVPGELESLRQVLDRLDLRPNIRRKIDKYSEQWCSVTIIENVETNYMGDVFKDISNSITRQEGQSLKA